MMRIDKIPVWFLFANNAVPIFGLLFLGWRVFDAAFILLADVAFLGIFALIKIMFIKNSIIKPYTQKITIKSSSYGIGGSTSNVTEQEKVITNPIYIKLNAVSVTIVGLLLGVGIMSWALFEKLGVEFNSAIIIFCISPLLSHLVSFVKNYILSKEYNIVQPMDVANTFMLRLGSIIFTIGFGLFLGKWFLLLIVLLFKTFADYKLHIKEHSQVYIKSI